MRCSKVVLLFVIAGCAFGSVSAQAALPEWAGTFPVSFTVSSTSPVFEIEGGILKVGCAKSEGKGEILGAKSMSFDELVLDCKGTVSGIPIGSCTGLSDTTSGSVLAKGTTTMGYRLGTLVPLAALALSPEVHFECPGGNLALVRGCLLGTTTLARSLDLTLKFEGENGKQKYLDYTNDKAEAVSCKLESSLNGGAFKPSAQVETATLLVSKEVQVLD